MNTLSYKTVSVNKATAQKEWVLVDAKDLVLGRMASQVAKLLTGKKWTDRIYFRHTLYPGGQRESTPAELMAKSPETLIKKVVKGMLPKNILASHVIKNLYVYAGSEHPHTAQSPKLIDLKKIR